VTVCAPRHVATVLALTSTVSVARAEDPAHIVVRGEPAVARARQSPDAVDVVDLSEDNRRAADLGQVLATRTSLRVQREGGLGSAGRYSLNGLSGDRVRFFLDGVPLELSAYQMGVANVPLGLVDRVELYQGVVPVRFGADALGGAVNLVSDEKPRDARAFASYQLGAFSTHRLALGGRAFFEKSRMFLRGSAFVDSARNDYPVDVETSDDQGQPKPATVRRFHDGYRGVGATLGAGLLDRPWADRLVVQAFVADYARDVQHNPGMTVPYGEVTYGRGARGAQLGYRKRFGRLRLDALTGHAERSTRFRDLSRCRYDWYGRCFLELPLAGEVDSVPSDRRIGDSTWYGRFDLQWRLGGAHALRLSLSPTMTTRSGGDAQIASDQYDALRAARSQRSGVIGLEYEGREGRLGSSVFAKGYCQRARSRERLPSGVLQRQRTDELLFGAGDALRWSLFHWLALKASYEYAARLPTADERFGDGGLVADNLQLAAERSHNYNLGAFVESAPTSLGTFEAKLSGALRRVQSMIVLINAGAYYQYTNVLAARVLAAHASARYRNVADWLGLELSAGYEDMRNTSRVGPGKLFYGDRIPNQPQFQAGGAVSLRARDLVTSGDSLDLVYGVRHVRKFLRGWESAGGEDAVKLDVPGQTLHSLSLTHVTQGAAMALASTFEVQNLGDAKAFDFYGVQRPGRSFFWKTTLEYR